MKHLLIFNSVFVGIFLIATTFSSPTFAQTTSGAFDLNANSNVPRNQSTFIQSALLESFSFLNCQLMGSNPNSPTNQCLGFDPTTKKIGYVKNNGGILGMIVDGVSSTYSINIHFHDYTQQVAQNFGLARPAYAATTGAQQLSPFFPVWVMVRNVTYVFFVIAFIVIGVSIMLRVKIDPRAVITIQNQLPRIVIALVLISFSYGISSFLIDTMYVTTYASFSLVAKSGLIKENNIVDLTNAQANMNTDNPLQNFQRITSIPGLSKDVMGNAKDLFFGTVMDNAPTNGGTDGLLQVIGNGVKALVGTILLTIFSGIFTVGFFYFILIGILIWTLLRVWFNLLKSFIVVIVDTIIAPLWIFLGIFPSSKVNFESWFRHLAGYLAVFPATVLFFLVAKGFQDTLGRSEGNFSLPLVGTGQGPQSLSGFVTFAMILLAPKLQDWILAVFKAPSGGTIATAIMGGFNEGRQKYDKGLVQPTKGFAQNALFHGPRVIVTPSEVPGANEIQGSLRAPLLRRTQVFADLANRQGTRFSGVQRIIGNLGLSTLNRIGGEKARLTEDRREQTQQH